MKHAIYPIICLLLISAFSLSGCNDDEDDRINYPLIQYPTEEKQSFTATDLCGHLRFDEEIQEWIIRPMFENFGHPSIELGDDEAYMIVSNMKEEYEKYAGEVIFSGETNLSHYIIHDESMTVRTHVYNIELSDINRFREIDYFDLHKYRVAQLTITTENAAPIVSKDKADYINCTVNVESEKEEWNYTGTGRIRGRGNSTWLWYPKKPYRIKLDKKAEILGLATEKDWVLLANYRDPTHIMNTFVFVTGEALGLPYTNHSRYVEVTLNGDYIGLYQLTEQVEQGDSRVAVDEKQGMLISLDADDGPALNPGGGDNFWSTVYKMPICVKNPEDATAAQLQVVQDDFALLEQTIRNSNYEETAQLMNIPAFIDYMLIQELVYNVEVDAPRSIYMHKDKGGLWTMGPLWDFDAGFDFDWATMYTGHNYFASYRELVLGTDPANHIGGYNVPSFFTDLFKSKRFVSEYKVRWKEIRYRIMTEFWEETHIYVANSLEAMERDATRWPIDKNYQNEINRMKQWLTQRVSYLDTVINNYPAGTK